MALLHYFGVDKTPPDRKQAYNEFLEQVLIATYRMGVGKLVFTDRVRDEQNMKISPSLYEMAILNQDKVHMGPPSVNPVHNSQVVVCEITLDRADLRIKSETLQQKELQEIKHKQTIQQQNVYTNIFGATNP